MVRRLVGLVLALTVLALVNGQPVAAKEVRRTQVYSEAAVTATAAFPTCVLVPLDPRRERYLSGPHRVPRYKMVSRAMTTCNDIWEPWEYTRVKACIDMRVWDEAAGIYRRGLSRCSPYKTVLYPVLLNIVSISLPCPYPFTKAKFRTRAYGQCIGCFPRYQSDSSAWVKRYC